MTTFFALEDRFIHVESTTYPVMFEDIKRLHPTTSFPSEPSLELLAAMGYAVVLAALKPPGDVVEETIPQLNEDGQYVQTFTARAFTPEELQQQLQTQQAKLLLKVREKRTASVEIGAPINLGATHGIQHIQLRDGDRANIVGLRVAADSLLAMGLGGSGAMVFRTFENKLVPLSAAQMVELSQRALYAYQELMGMAWAMEDEISSAKTLQELPELPALFVPTQQDLLLD